MTTVSRCFVANVVPGAAATRRAGIHMHTCCINNDRRTVPISKASGGISIPARRNGCIHASMSVLRRCHKREQPERDENKKDKSTAGLPLISCRGGEM